MNKMKVESDQPILILGLVSLRWEMNLSRSLGEISNGMELFITERSANLMDTLRTDIPAVARIPVVFFTSEILSMGNRWGRKNWYTTSWLPSISYQHPTISSMQISWLHKSGVPPTMLSRWLSLWWRRQRISAPTTSTNRFLIYRFVLSYLWDDFINYSRLILLYKGVYKGATKL